MGGSSARRWGTVAMLGLALGLAGCAAGSPAAVVPDPAGEQAAAPAVAAPRLTPLADAAATTSDAPVDGAVGDAAPAGPDAAAGAAQAAVDAAPAAAAESAAPTAAAGVAEVAAEPVGSADAADSDGAVQGAPPATDPAAAAAPIAAGGVAAPAFAAAPTLAAAGAAPPAAAAAPAGAETTDPPAAAQAGGRPPVPETDGSGLSQLIEGHADGRKEVALTFDAGSDRGYSEAILDFLRDNGIKATFGMTGAWAEQNPDLIQRMVAEGHQLINHTWSHRSMTGGSTGTEPETFAELSDELARTEQIVRELTGYELKPYFRPPYGDIAPEYQQHLYDLGYPFTIMWTCDTRGWDGWQADKILEYCTSVPLEDDIILMHVGAAAAGDYEVLPSMVAWYRDNGYAFVTVEEMLQP